MSIQPNDVPHAQHSGYRHEALLYAGLDGFLAGTLPFVRGALDAGEPILVVLGAEKIEALRGELGDDAGAVLFADMAVVGSNPARIIPAWQDFLGAHSEAAGRIWGIGEPIWAGRSAPALTECQRHEQLLNLAFEDPDFSLLCPYDTGTLPSSVVEEARRSHPFVSEGGASAHSAPFAGVAELANADAPPLTEPPASAAAIAFGAGELREVRAWIARHAAAEGMAPERINELLLAANEITTNSLVHGGGSGTVALWREHDAIVCEVRDRGRLTDPLAGRRRPSHGGHGGRGLWTANQLADLLQIRALAEGTVVRIHMLA